MKFITASIVLCLISFSTIAQDDPLSVFADLDGTTWLADGNWGNGQKFKQEATFEMVLADKTVMVTSKGFTNQEQTEYGVRNIGYRQYDPATGIIRFWEFDVFGGVTEGEAIVDGKDIWYQYQYGESVVTDAWEYVNDSTYKYTVGEHDGSEWKAVYLETEFRKISN